jgi:aminoglycoside phosphotransferase (APT) family kinase protein
MTAAPGPEPIDTHALSSFLNAAGVHVVGELNVSPLAGGRSNPTFALSDGHSAWVLRRPPYAEVLQSAHDMGREARVMSALWPTEVPVPRIVAGTDDRSVIGAPFYVMERVQGRPLRNVHDAAALTAGQRADLSKALVNTLAALHDVDPHAVGLGDWGRPDGYLERQVARWARQWEAVATRDRPEVIELLGRLASALPTSPRPAIVHGDFKVDNVMIGVDDPGEVRALLDWEMSTFGDPLADLGLLLSFWDEPGRPFHPITAGTTALPGFWSAADIAKAYAQLRDVDLAGIEWYVAFADVKIAVVLEQIHARQVSDSGRKAEDVGAMVDPLIDRALTRSW